MTLHDTIQADADSVFCNADDFAEPVTYYPRAGEARPISAVVLREQLAVLPEDGDSVLPVFEIHVANNSTTGIASHELNLGGDALEFAVRVGQQASKRSILKLLGHDEGMLVLECR
jgi:hypothetical protein